MYCEFILLACIIFLCITCFVDVTLFTPVNLSTLKASKTLNLVLSSISPFSQSPRSVDVCHNIYNWVIQ